jgi:hemolysin activation/secretion protein
MLLEGQNVTAEDINNFIDIINSQYAKKKIITARAILESLEGGVLKVELMEARIGSIQIEGNKFNRKWFLKKQISSKPSDILNLQTLEEDLRMFNKNARSIKLSAKLQPGEEYGTTDVIIKADEEFPYHFSASWDSFGRETTGLLRSGLMVSADSLFGFQDRLTGAINMARSSFNPFVDYNVPINKKGTRFGGSYMYGKSKVTSGDYKDFDLNANTHVFSTYISHPLIETQRAQLKLNTSANIKLSTADISGFQYTNYKDYNLAVGLGGRYNFNKSVLFGSLYSTNGIIQDDIRSYSQYFTKINADGYYIHYLPKGIIATVRTGGQYSPYNVPFLEQYQIGGISSVRGYSESLLLGGNSYFVSMEMLFPIPFLPEEIKVPFKKEGTFRLKDSIKFATFVDNGAIIPKEGKTGTTNFLASVGAGLRIAVSKFLTARVYVGVPLMNAGIYDQANARLHFDLIASPF